MKFLSWNKIKNFIPYIIPVIGVIFFQWNTFAILLFFCLENILQGIFFVLRGGALIRHGGSVLFLIIFCLLYFSQAICLISTIFSLKEKIPLGNIPSFFDIAINLTILAVPHLQELFRFIKSTNKLLSKKIMASDASNTENLVSTKQNVLPFVDYLLDFKELFLRLILIWLTTFFGAILLLLSVGLKIPSDIYSFIIILTFSIIHYKIGKYAVAERQKMENLIK